MSILIENKQNFAAEFSNLVSQNLIYCFQIKLQDGRDLYLTESDQAITIDDMIFVPNAGLSLKEGEFNDSAQNYIILAGIFEFGAIEQQMDLTGAKVKILIYFQGATFELQNKSVHHFITYYCSLYTKHDLTFSMRLEPPIVAYNQSLLLSFSKTCRANFGDIKCKINKTSYSQSYHIKEMFGKTLIISNLDKDDGYFNCGDAIFSDNQFQAKIVSQFGSLIILDQVIPDNVKHYQYVKLIAGCDKDFITCCNKFNNAINFRGEPFIPDHNYYSVGLKRPKYF